MQQQNRPQRKILVEFTFDWDDYEDVDDELMFEDAALELRDGVSYKIIKPEPVSAPSISSNVNELWDEYSAMVEIDERGVASSDLTEWMDKDGFLTAIEKFRESFCPSVQPQSEGWLQWVKGTKRLPSNENLVHLRYGKDKSSMATGFYDTEQGRWYYANGTPIVWHPDLEWLDESASPSTANTEEERLNKETTGFNTVAERVAYDEGYADHEKVMTQWIEKWDGSTNSGLGALLARKFKELNTEEGATHRTPLEQAVHCLKVLDISRKEVEAGKADCKYLCFFIRTTCEAFFSLNPDLLQLATKTQKEQQIAFAEWLDYNCYQRDPITGDYFKGFQKGFTLSQLYEIFLTETKQQ